MTGRAFGYTLSRPRVLVPAVIGAALLLGGGWKIAGFVLLGVAFFKALRLLDSDDLDHRLAQRHTRQRHGVWRQLNHAEGAEMQLIERYAAALKASGADPALARDTVEEAWRIVARQSSQDATVELRQFRQSLPPLPEVHGGTAGLSERIRAELDLLRATRKEIETLP